MRRSLTLATPLLVAIAAACSSTPEPAANPGTSGTATGGGGAGTTAGTSGGGAPSASGTSGTTATGGGGSAGTGGSGAGVGGGGSGGSGGGAPGCEELGTPGKTGRQCAPDMMDNGTHDQIEPTVNLPPEAMGNPAGELSQNKTLQSAVYGYDFTYRTYKPTAYQAGKPAALMIFQDGGNYTGNFKAPQVFDKLIAEGSVPVTISVYIEPTGQRSVEYDTRSNKYGMMLTTELLPELAKTFELVDDPNGWAIGGHSSGGSCAFNAAWWFTDKLRKVMTHSGSFIHLQDPGDDEYIEIVQTEAVKPIRVTLQSGSEDLECCGSTWFEANNDMAASLTEKGYAYRYLKSTTEHGPTKWHIVDFPVAMRWLWKGYTLPHYAAQ